MATSTPTYADQPYGALPFERFDYWKHPDGTPGGNPVLFLRHGGGGIGGDYRGFRSDAQGNEAFYFCRWLNNAHTNSPAQHWDLCSFSSGQFIYGDFQAPGNPIPRCVAMFEMDAVRSCQRAISRI
jgi:hypothetical protein